MYKSLDKKFIGSCRECLGCNRLELEDFVGTEQCEYSTYKKVGKMKTKVYRCDPNKNIKCNKKHCYRRYGPCKYTFDKRYRMNIFKRIKEWIIERSF